MSAQKFICVYGSFILYIVGHLYPGVSSPYIQLTTDVEGQLYALHYSIPFYIRDLSILGISYSQVVLETIPHRFQETTVIDKYWKQPRRSSVVDR